MFSKEETKYVEPGLPDILNQLRNISLSVQEEEEKDEEQKME